MSESNSQSPSGLDPNSPPASRNTRHSGRWMVLAMFAFAITATGLLYVYWRMHIAPFLPLQKALAATFKDSRPRVEGGQRKIHKGTPRILRVTMKIDFDPDADEARTMAFANRVVAFVREHQDLAPWEILEIHFYWPEPEKELHEWVLERSLNDGVPAAR